MIKGEVTVIRRPADDVETWMNIQRRKSTVCIRLVCILRLCVCAFVEYVSTTESGLPRSSRVVISSLQQIYSRGALQLKLLGRKCTNEYAARTLQLMFVSVLHVGIQKFGVQLLYPKMKKMKMTLLCFFMVSVRPVRVTLQTFTAN